MQDMYADFELHQSAGKQIVMVISALLMTVVSGFLILLIDENPIMGLIGIIGAVFFGLCTVLWLRLVFGSRVGVRLTRDGFYDYTSAIATRGRLVKWQDVSSINPIIFGGQPHVSVDVHDRDTYLATLPAMSRQAVKANLRLGTAPINIVTRQAKGMNHEELATLMRSYHANAVRSQ
ncbi:STM3941 family protein [Jonesia quinghaiensis]|uniref:STM3941 family protein n=1 Tax=Jonesia quinghaiensis TaxID=262806 RepID=UPI00040E6B07|nr:STM3941 family protein [Jonesia quinghaiensis]